MIRPDDFEIRFESEPAGTVVRVTHIPTGNQRRRLVGVAEMTRHVSAALIAELQEILFVPDEVRVDIGRSTGGDFIRVTHVPSGIQRSAMRKERSEIELLDEVLNEFYSDPANLVKIREPKYGTEGDRPN